MLQEKKKTMFYISALMAIVGGVGYQYFIKRVPGTINPLVSVAGIYVAVLAISAVLMPLFLSGEKLVVHIRQLSWIQIALAVSVIFIELGYLLMYRNGWILSTGNVTTGVFVNLTLAAIGAALLGEHLSVTNLAGIALCILGVALMGWRS